MKYELLQLICLEFINDPLHLIIIMHCPRANNILYDERKSKTPLKVPLISIVFCFVLPFHHIERGTFDSATAEMQLSDKKESVRLA
jgi:hypothetical protein